MGAGFSMTSLLLDWNHEGISYGSGKVPPPPFIVLHFRRGGSVGRGIYCINLAHAVHKSDEYGTGLLFQRLDDLRMVMTFLHRSSLTKVIRTTFGSGALYTHLGSLKKIYFTKIGLSKEGQEALSAYDLSGCFSLVKNSSIDEELHHSTLLVQNPSRSAGILELN
jgi:hypothetical protein